ncbi:hypothetical protein QAD02_011811 [Eretmocerus hayati]|uniref:Uncharacterized protein n=1 Tax=Eretmocerus hayati TaxID=131215 RepID=A0ACC2NXU8_9HYME|nr:hypothetical protein QAD02_011811 [Eretmocerus hayati]
MSSGQEMCLQESTEIDSESSSSEERESRRRHLGDADSLPKKRRKQSTPVKFPTTLGADDCEDSEEELPGDNSYHHHDANNSLDDENEHHTLEGKLTSSPTLSKSAQSLHRLSTIKDENLNNEFRCQYCSQFFDNRVALEIHLECEHSSESPQILNSLQGQLSPESGTQQVNLENSLSPINLSGISLRNFAASTSWLAGQAQLQTQADVPLAKMVAARNNNHFQTMPASFPGPLAQFLPIPGFPIPDASQIQRAAMGQFPKIFNPDAYCELCNKEFCNKYFLKTHKANKHGIYSDNPVSQSQPGDVTLPGQFVTTTSGQVGNFGLKTSGEQILRLENNGLQQPTVPCDLCPKRFKNEDSLRKHRYKIHMGHNNESVDPSQIQVALPSSSGEDERQSPVGLEILCKQEISIDQDDSNLIASRLATMSPQNVQNRDFGVNGNRWQRLGVMNPEAFCELCSKEYCNKYFLRTHKLKKHGIAMPESDKAQNNSLPWHQVQTSPLDLIVSDRFGNGSESGDRVEDFQCKSCGISFQTQGLYQLHVEKIHENMEQLSPKQDQEIDSTDRRTEAISEDLQKLQTMILQLNGLDSNKAASCALCGKDYDNPNALRNHMISEHSIIPENLSPSQQQQLQQQHHQQHMTCEKKSPSPSNTSANCTVCEKDYPNQETLRKHMQEDHQPSTPTSSTQLSSSVPTTPKSTSSQLSERKTTANITPTSSYCEICNKELCNKYFMKIHMQKMHGIEIENGAQISGVVCNICKKELCSKYFLRVHKQNTHGIVEEGTTPAKQDNFETPVVGEDSALKAENLGDLNIRYVTHFTEVCPFCHRRFRSVRWLMSHLPEHKKAGLEKLREMEQYQQSLQKSRGSNSKSIQQQQQQQQQNHVNAALRIPNGFEPNQHIRSDLATHQVLSNFFGNAVNDQQGQLFHCSHENCNFSTPIRPYLFLHERSHIQETSLLENERLLQCPICAQSFNQPEMLLQHVATRHSNPLPGLLSQFPFPLLNEFALANEHQIQQLEKNEYSESKEDLRRTSPQITNDIDLSKKENNSVQVVPPGSFKCSQCGFVSANLTRMKKHMKKDHKCLGDPAETALAELSKTLKDVANKHKVPASYAMPQEANYSLDKTVMQAFIIEELDNSQNGSNGDSLSPTSGRFAPALVYLPVKTRVNGALTTSFTLNPA